MPTHSSTAKFIACCAKADKYPLNLSQYGSNNGSLLAHRILLQENAPDLFHLRSDVVTLELKNDNNAENTVLARKYRTDDEINSWLNEPEQDGSTPASNIRCRFIFIQATSSQAKLNVSLAHIRRIFTYFQVMPSYIDFISVFTTKRTDEADVSDVRFSSFRERIRLGVDNRSLDLPHMALSGRGYQLSYNLKCISNTKRDKAEVWAREKHNPDDWVWSTRQAAFHHQFDMKEGTSLWILTAARGYLQERVQRLVGQRGSQTAIASTDEDDLESREEDRTFTTTEKSFIASLSVHLMIAQYASGDWRGHIRWLEQMLEKRTREALISEDYNPREFDLVDVQIMEDKTNRAAMTLNANTKVLESLATFYQKLMKNEDFELHSKPDCKNAVDDFLAQLRDYAYDMRMFSERAEGLAKITADRKTLIQERLQTLASDRVMNLTIQQQREAKIMRVIALVTLIYLPATFVSTFFSTDVVKYQPDGDNEDAVPYTSYSGLALERWFEVTVPLTILTFVVAVGWYYGYDHVKTDMKSWWKRDRVIRDPEKQNLGM